MKSNSNENGYTMIETIMYISVMIVLGGVLAKYVHTVFLRYKTGRASQQVVDIKKAVIQYTATDEDYRRLDLDKMVADRALPYDVMAKVNALGGKISLGPVSKIGSTPSGNAKDDYMFYVTFDGLPQSSCVELLSQGQFYGGGSDIDCIIANDTTRWGYTYSLYDGCGAGNNKSANVAKQNGSNAESIMDKITMTAALKACHKKIGNKITWIFS